MDPKDRVETLIKTKVSSIHKRISGNDSPAGAGYQVEQADVEEILAEWPAAPKKVAESLLERYGPPNEATPSQLIWHNNGPWKRTVVTRDEALHNTSSQEFLYTGGPHRWPMNPVDSTTSVR